MVLNEKILELWEEYNILSHKHTKDGFSDNEFIDDTLTELIINVVEECDYDAVRYGMYQNIAIDLYHERYEWIGHYKELLERYEDGELSLDDIRKEDTKLYNEIIEIRTYIGYDIDE